VVVQLLWLPRQKHTYPNPMADHAIHFWTLKRGVFLLKMNGYSWNLNTPREGISHFELALHCQKPRYKKGSKRTIGSLIWWAVAWRLWLLSVGLWYWSWSLPVHCDLFCL
jgi:hypothetical protein